MTGVVQNQDSYMKGRIAQRAYYASIALRSSRSHVRGQRSPAALPLRSTCSDRGCRPDSVAMDTIVDTAIDVVDLLRDADAPSAPLQSPRSGPSPQVRGRGGAQSEACGGRRANRRAAAADNPLTRETKAALYGAAARGAAVPRVLSVSAGLGSRDVRAGDLAAVFDRSSTFGAGDPDYAVLGIKHPLALAAAPIDIRPSGAFCCAATPSAGSARSPRTSCSQRSSASCSAIRPSVSAVRIGEKGPPTSYNLTVADVPIRAHGRSTGSTLFRCMTWRRFARIRSRTRRWRDRLRPSTLTDANDIWASIPAAARADIVSRRVRVTALDTASLARAIAPKPDLVLRMQGIALVGVFLRVTRFAEDAGLDRAALLAAVEARLRRFYGKRGDDVIAGNMEVVAAAFDGVIDVSEALGFPHGVERSLAVVPPEPRAMVAVPA